MSNQMTNGVHNTSSSSGMSFCIITNGARPDKLSLVVESIRRQCIAESEIIIVGTARDMPGVVRIEADAAAAAGQLGHMRNLGVCAAQYERVTILDDDILLGVDWFAAMQRVGGARDIVTSRILLPDGTRYWDYSTVGGPRGHMMLRADESPDDFVYMSGGTAWVLPRAVMQDAQWESALGFYEGEDVRFARACVAAGYQIVHNADAIAWHNDGAYTRIGRRVERRAAGVNHLWLRDRTELKSAHQLKLLVIAHIQQGQRAEVADVLRAGAQLHRSDPYFAALWEIVQAEVGGDAGGDRWHLDGAPELNALVTMLQASRPTVTTSDSTHFRAVVTA